MNNTDFNRLKASKSRVGKLGETAVILKLTEMGWDAFNLNATNPNYKGVDVLAVNPQTLESLFIQVKSSASDEPNFPTGLISDTEGNIIVRENKEWVKDDNWKEKFVGPWVFVHIKLDDEDIKYDFYILTKEDVVKLIEDSNKWYWNNVGKAKGQAQPVGLPLCWITGEGLVQNANTFRGYPRNVGIDKNKLCGNAGWEEKIGTVKKGLCYKVECPYCNHIFKWHEGSGKKLDVLHCDKCGKELLTTDRSLKYCNVKCECGGFFDKEVPIICPNCHKEIDRPRSYILDAQEWH